MRPKFYADENIPLTACNSLKIIKIDILTTFEANMQSRSDSEQLRFASLGGRAVITHDTDFLRIKESISHNGILFITRQLSIGELVREIEHIALAFAAEDLKNTVIFLPFHQEQ